MSADFTPRRRAKDCIYWVVGAYGTGGIEGQDSNLVVNKKRAKDHAEIYTPLPVIKFMYKTQVDNAQKSSQARGEEFRRDLFMAYSGTLEPSCGSGNFLEIIIREKLKALFRSIRENIGVELKYLRYSTDALVFMILSVNSLYGLDLQPDNVIISRNRIFIFIHKTFKRVYGRRMQLSEARIFAYLLRMQIQHNNALIGLPLYISIKHIGGGRIEYYFSRHNHKTWERRDMNGWGVVDSSSDKGIAPFKGSLANMRAVYQDYLRAYYEGDRELHALQNEDFSKWGFIDLRTQQSGYQAYIKHKPLMDQVDAVFDQWNKDIESVEPEPKKQYSQGRLF